MTRDVDYIRAGFEDEEGDAFVETTRCDGCLCAGHAIVSAGMIAYGGPFTAGYRTELEATWFAKLREASIPHTAGCNLKQFLGTKEKGTAPYGSFLRVPHFTGILLLLLTWNTKVWTQVGRKRGQRARPDNTVVPGIVGGVHLCGRSITSKSNERSRKKNGGSHVLRTFFAIENATVLQFRKETLRQGASESAHPIVLTLTWYGQILTLLMSVSRRASEDTSMECSGPSKR